MKKGLFLNPQPSHGVVKKFSKKLYLIFTVAYTKPVLEGLLKFEAGYMEMVASAQNLWTTKV
jgi:hypothetical protein